jgi:hypothetical protein
MYLFAITYIIVKTIQTSRRQLFYYLEFVKVGLWFQGQAFPKNNSDSCALKNDGEVLRRQVFSQRYRTTCQETWILSTTSVRSSNPARLKSLHQHTYSRVLRHEMQSCTNGTKGHSAFLLEVHWVNVEIGHIYQSMLAGNGVRRWQIFITWHFNTRVALPYRKGCLMFAVWNS